MPEPKREREIERRDLERAHGRDRKAAEQMVERERERHSQALDRWLADQE